MAIFFNELNELYSALIEKREAVLEPLPVQYPDYSAWQREWISGPLLEEQITYWEKELSGAPELIELPKDYRRPLIFDYKGARIDFILSDAVSKAVKQFASKHGVTLFMVFMAAWAILLSRLSRQNDLVIGTLTANRGRQEIENLIGFFVNTIALRVKFSEEMTVEELLMQVKEKALKAQEYQDVPFEKIVETLAPSRSAAYSPLFQVTFTWQSNETVEPKFPGVKTVIFKEIDYPYEKFDLSLSMKETGSTITGILSYAQSLFSRSTIDSYKRYFIAILEKMTVYDRNNIKDLLIIPDDGSQLVKVRNKVDGNLVCKTKYEAPVGDIEKKLESIIAGVLKKEKVGRHDNFFCLGGHSLLAIKVIYMVFRDFGAEVSLSRFIAEPYINKLAEYILNQKNKPCA